MADFSLKIGQATPLLRNRSFCRLWAAQFGAVTAAYGLSLAGLALVEEQTRSSAQTGLTIVSSILPAFLGSLVAGAAVDRWQRARVLRAGHLARAAVALGFWAGTRLLPMGWAVVVVYLANAAVAACTQFALSAEMAMLPDLAGDTRLVSANALLHFSTLVAEGLGIVLLGPLTVKLAGAPTMGWVGALLYLLALALVASLPRDGTSVDRAGKEWAGWGALASDMRAGWRIIAHDGLLRLVAVQATLAAATLLVLLSLVPGLVSRHLGLQVEDAPFLMLSGGLGFGLGAFLISRWESRLSRPTWIAVGLIGMGAMVGLLGILAGEAEPLRLLLLTGTILGVGVTLALILVPARTVLQEHPPPQLRGRVVAAQLALGNAAAVIPLILGGALADWLGIRPMMGLLGLLALAAGVLGLHGARR
jgi:MFS family permease